MTGIFTGQTLTMNDYPWEIYQKAIDMAGERLKTPIKAKKDNSEEKYEREIELRLENFNRKFIQFDSKVWKIFYTILFVFIVLFISGLGSFLSYTFTRLIIKEMLDIKGILTLIALFILNTIIAFVVAILTLTTIPLLITPNFWGLFVVMITESFIAFILTFSIIIPIILSIFLFIVSILGILIEPNWLFIITLFSMLPTILLYFFIILLMPLLLFKDEIITFFSYLLLKAADHEGGVIAFSVIILAILTVLIDMIIFLIF